MKSSSSQQMRVGIFVTLGLVLSMAVIFLLGDIGDLFQRRFTLYTNFNDTTGVRVGSPIFLAGINVGKVEAIRFPKTIEEKKIVVTMKIQREFHDRIRKDSEAKITTQGLLGDKAIFITVGSADEPEVKSGGEIKARKGLSIESFGEKGAELLDNINDLIADIKSKDSLLHALLYDPKGEEIIQDLAGMISSVKDIRKISNFFH